MQGAETLSPFGVPQRVAGTCPRVCAGRPGCCCLYEARPRRARPVGGALSEVASGSCWGRLQVSQEPCVISKGTALIPLALSELAKPSKRIPIELNGLS